MSLLAIDPGDVHCGVAWFKGTDCVQQRTTSPAALIKILEKQTPDTWVVEEYKLYAWVNQSFSEMKTAQLIGVIKYLASKKGKVLVMQPAMVKKVAAGHMRATKQKRMMGDRHSQDAQLHGFYFLMRAKGVVS